MDEECVYVIAVTFHSDQLWVLLEKKSEVTESTAIEFGYFTSNKSSVYNNVSASKFVQNNIQSLLKDCGEIAANVKANEKDVLVSGDRRIFIVLLPSMIADEVVTRALISKGIITSPLFSHLAQCLDLQRTYGRIDMNAKEIATMTSVFQSDTPMYRYLSQLNITKRPEFIANDSAQSAMNAIQECLPNPRTRAQSAPPTILCANCVEILNSGEALMVIHRLLVSYSPIDLSLSRQVRYGPFPGNKAIMQACEKDWSLRASTWAEMYTFYSENQLPLSLEAQGRLKHIEYDGIVKLGRVLLQDTDAPKPLPTLKTINTLCEILPGLYLSNAITASNAEMLREKGITHILRVLQGNQRCLGFTYAVISVEDQEDINLLHYFEAAKMFIDAGRRAGGCLVHCRAGVSRSATLILAYVMSEVFRTEPLSLMKAFYHVHRFRSIICPNDGFLRQLIHYENLLSTPEFTRLPVERLIKSVLEENANGGPSSGSPSES